MHRKSTYTHTAYSAHTAAAPIRHRNSDRHAVNEEMDIINLSLGGGANTETDAGSFAINNAMLAGTIAVVATGNSGPNRGTMGTPSTSRLGIAVGNTTNPEARYFGDVNINVGSYNLSKDMNLMGHNIRPRTSPVNLTGEYGIVAVPGLGEATDYDQDLM